MQILENRNLVVMVYVNHNRERELDKINTFIVIVFYESWGPFCTFTFTQYR